MPDTDEIRRLLERYGFSEAAADAYLAVVERGSATVSTVADAADISTSHVYDVCDELEAKGFVTVKSDRTPTALRAVPPDRAFDSLRSDLDALQSAVDDRYQRPGTADEELSVVKSRSTIIKRLRSYIRAADSEVVLQLPARRLPEIADPLRDARDRGVLVLLSLCGDAAPDAETAPATGAPLEGVASTVRLAQPGMPSLLSVDQERGFVSPATMLGWDHDDTRAITFAQPDIAAILVGSYLGNYWPLGEELLVSRPPDLPRTFERFRPAVFTAALHRRSGRSVDAECYLRETGTEEPFETRRGEVVEVRQNLLAPSSSDFGFENSLRIDFGEETAEVGGYEAFLEEYETKRTTLRPA
ncbi:transcriptional regulator [Halorubrum sp. SP3]|uniref:TrmB family transcriptional regulator n=1 Tax=Halorubrum sp. SP3 TaxID=1537265 RepID=UPI0010F9C518|nr:TrmB family transcriptional regulator sugar-binding domain-containing protein [Halorubrum sp. SP3]TKX56048.1 transcriptional regulator [Halorubrum sp. SP3]